MVHPHPTHLRLFPATASILGLVRLILLAVLGAFAPRAGGKGLPAEAVPAAAALSPPYPTGTHPQWMREFYTTADGLPASAVSAITITRAGDVLAGANRGVARLEGRRWVPEPGPAGVLALFSPASGAQVWAGTTNSFWVRKGGTWNPDPTAPVGVHGFASEPDGTPWALGAGGVWRHATRWERIHRIADDEMKGPLDLLPAGPGSVLIAAETGLFRLTGKRKYWLPYEVGRGRLLSAHTRALARLGPHHFLVATDQGLNLSNGTRFWQAITGAQGLPIIDLRHLAVARDATVWLGSNQGLIRWHGGRWTYLAGKRWLPNDRVSALAPTPNGVWVATPAGVAHLFQQPMSLAEKAVVYQRTAEERDRRHGYMTLMQLKAPGVIEGALQEISDNDGLWTALYIASQSFRYAVTASTDARAQASRSMRALLNLERLTGISGFPARAVCRTDEPQFTANAIASNPEWHPSPVDPDWYWKGDTSSDEIDGHFFGWYVFYQLAANDRERQAVRDTCARVTDHILDHGYYLVDLDGRPTTWGVWAPEKLNDDPVWWEERGLNSLQILSHLKVAAAITGNRRYEDAYHNLIQNHGYALNTLEAKIPDGVSHDDQLLFLAYYPLLQLERDPGPRALYLASLRRTWKMERIEANPLWNFIFGASTGQPCGVEAAVRTLRAMPLDLIAWRTHNARRVDLRFEPERDRRGNRRLVKPLEWTARVIQNWDGDPRRLDGGNNRTEGDPTIWLLPYWMGRYHRIIQ